MTRSGGSEDLVIQEPYLVDLSELFSVLVKRFYLILAITIAAATISLFYALSIAEQYRASALLAPVTRANNQISSSLNMVAVGGLAGLNFGNNNRDETKMALAILTSKLFISKFIETQGLAAPLVASTGWDRESGELMMDSFRWDSENGAWKDIDGQTAEPSEQELHSAFLQRLGISQDSESGFVSLAFEFYSPQLAQQWLSNVIAALNSEMKNQDIAEAQKNIKYLSNLVEQTQIIGMQQVVYSLIESEIRTSMLASVRDDYVFRYIDPPTVPEERSKPNRRLIVILGSLSGLFLSIFIALAVGLVTGDYRFQR